MITVVRCNFQFNLNILNTLNDPFLLEDFINLAHCRSLVPQSITQNSWGTIDTFVSCVRRYFLSNSVGLLTQTIRPQTFYRALKCGDEPSKVISLDNHAHNAAEPDLHIRSLMMDAAT